MRDYGNYGNAGIREYGMNTGIRDECGITGIIGTREYGNTG